MAQSRLDAELASRGLARSRSHAQQLIAAASVRVNGETVLKAARPVSETDELSVDGETGYVSRAAMKLLGALDEFRVDPAGRWCLDVGASTGGFTQVLLERGAAGVVAVDVGHGQLAQVLVSDPRVVSVEGQNVRDLTGERYDEIALATGENGGPAIPRPSLIVTDVSFISLTLVLARLREVGTKDADVIVLIKPQFEVGKSKIKNGLVTDAALRQEAIETVLWAAFYEGFGVLGLARSGLVGEHGNQEYVAHLRAVSTAGLRGDTEPRPALSDEAPDSPAQWRDRIREVSQ